MKLQLPHGSSSFIWARRRQTTRFCDTPACYWQFVASILCALLQVKTAQARPQEVEPARTPTLEELGRPEIVGTLVRRLQPEAANATAQAVALSSSTHVASLWTLHGGNASFPERDLGLIAAGFVAGIIVAIILFTIAMRMRPNGNNSNNADKAKPAAADGSPAREDPGQSAASGVPLDIEHEYDESLDSFWARTLVLVIMLMVQSLSSFILFLFRSLIVEHPEIIYFLTMLVGLGGNASGQSVVLAVREIAFGRDVQLRRQVMCGLGMGIVLAPVAYARAYLSNPVALTVAVVIAVSVVFITTAGTVVGTVLPKLFDQVAIDPGHTSPVVQVLMDMIGIAIVCTTGFVFLDLAEGKNSLS